MDRGELRLNWKSSGGSVWQWVLQKKTAGHWLTEILAGAKSGETIQSGPAMPLPEAALLFAVDRFGNVSNGATYRQAP